MWQSAETITSGSDIRWSRQRTRSVKSERCLPLASSTSTEQPAASVTRHHIALLGSGEVLSGLTLRQRPQWRAFAHVVRVLPSLRALGRSLRR